MLYFSIENARGEREKSPLLRGGLRRTVSCSDHSRIKACPFKLGVLK